MVHIYRVLVRGRVSNAITLKSIQSSCVRNDTIISSCPVEMVMLKLFQNQEIFFTDFGQLQGEGVGEAKYNTNYFL